MFQEAKLGKAAKTASGTVKAAVLRGDSLSLDLVVASCYNKKLFYMILHSCESITWVPVTKKVWSSTLKKTVDFNFLCWNLSNDYNYEMNGNDIADQLVLSTNSCGFNATSSGGGHCSCGDTAVPSQEVSRHMGQPHP